MALPDFRIPYQAVLGAQSVAQGGSFTLSYDVYDGSSGSAGPSTSAIYLSLNDAVFTSNERVATDAVPAIGPFEFSATQYVTISTAGLAAGRYYVAIKANYDFAVVELDYSNNTSPTDINVGYIDITSGGGGTTQYPDLTSTMYAPSDTTLDPGQAITVNYSVTNSGPVSAGYSYSGIYLSADPTITTADTQLTTDYVAAITQYGSSPGTASVVIPSWVTPGQTYYLGVVADDTTIYGSLVTESQAGNNASNGYAVTINSSGGGTQYPDLTATTFAPSDTTPDPGQLVTINYSVTNSGPVSAGYSYSGIYLSADPTITTADTQIAVDYVDPIAANSSSTEAVVATMPTWVTPGQTYYFGVIADDASIYGSLVTESQAGNNASNGYAVTVPNTTPTQYPDLTATTFAPSDTTPDPGQLVTINYSVTNSGPVSAGYSYSGIYLSIDPTITTADTQIAVDYVDPIAANSSSTEAVVATMPTWVTPGQTYYFGVIADDTSIYGSLVIESQAGNNASNGYAVTVPNTTPTQSPDLQVSAAALVTADLVPGGGGTLSYNVYNAGPGNASTSTVSRIYLSGDATLDGSDQVVSAGAINDAALAAYNNQTDQLPFTLPTGVAPGAYYLIAAVDDGHVLAETSESNNTAALAIAVTPKGAFSEFADTVTLTAPGQTIHVLGGNDVVIGSTGTDVAFGDAGDDQLYGRAGNDTLDGGADNDVIYGEEGQDAITGGDGNDTLVGNNDIFAKEADTLDGGAGTDIIYGEYTDNISGGSGFDILYAVNAFDWTINLAATGIELFIADFGNDTIDASGQSTGVEVVASGGNDTVTGSAFADRLWGGTGTDVLNGGEGDDMLFGDVGADQLRAGGGNDIIYADASDSIDGGGGFDVVYMTIGTGVTLDMALAGIEFFIDQAGGTNVITAGGLTLGANIYTGGGSDTITGSTFDDVLWGMGGVDSINAGAGADVLVGGTEADVLTPGSGTDRIYMNSGGGGDGAVDRIVLTTGWGSDTVYDFEHGIDKIDLSALATSFGSLTITSLNGAAVVQLGADTLTVAGQAGTLTAGDFVF